MLERASIMVAVLAAALSAAVSGAWAQQAAYPDFYGQWSRTTNSAQWDPSKPGGLKQQAGRRCAERAEIISLAPVTWQEIVKAGESVGVSPPSEVGSS